MLLDEGHLPKTAGKEEWAVYSTFVVADVGETLKKAESLGGSIRVYVVSSILLLLKHLGL